MLFWALDRFSREGMAQTIAHLQRLVSHGVAFHSYTEPHLATDNELVRNILLALLSSLAKLEAQKISDRAKAGMARAKANGIKIGRPKLGIEIRQKIARRAKKGETHMPSPKRSELIDTLQPSTRSRLPEERQEFSESKQGRGTPEMKSRQIGVSAPPPSSPIAIRSACSEPSYLLARRRTMCLAARRRPDRAGLRPSADGR